MDMLILLDGEFRSLIRNSLERIISTRYKKDDNKGANSNNSNTSNTTEPAISVFRTSNMLCILCPLQGSLFFKYDNIQFQGLIISVRLYFS